MLKILHITTIDMTTYCFHLPFLEFLVGQGFDVYAAFRVGKFTEKIQQKGVKVTDIPFERRIAPLNDLIALIQLISLLKREHFDIVHTATSKAGFLGRLAAYLTGVPIILHTVHELPQNSTQNVFLRWFYRKLETIAARWTEHIITVSNPNYNQIMLDGITSSQKITLIHNGINITKYDLKVDVSAKKKELGIPINAKVIGTVGRLEIPKGHKYLLQAIPLILQKIPNTMFLIIGDGMLREQLENTVKQIGLEKNVIFTGFREDLIEIMRTFDLFCLPSLWEGFGVVIAEAMACGLPVVASNVGGIPDVVENGVTGMLVLPKNVTELAETMIFLLNNPMQAQDMGQKGKERVKSLFTKERMLEKTWEVYQNCLSTYGVYKK